MAAHKTFFFQVQGDNVTCISGSNKTGTCILAFCSGPACSWPESGMYNASTAQHRLNLDMKNIFSFPQLILEEFQLITRWNDLFRISFPDSPPPTFMFEFKALRGLLRTRDSECGSEPPWIGAASSAVCLYTLSSGSLWITNQKLICANAITSPVSWSIH